LVKVHNWFVVVISCDRFRVVAVISHVWVTNHIGDIRLGYIMVSLGSALGSAG